MKNSFRTGRALTPWLSLAAPLLLAGSLMTLESLWPSLFCVEMNPGGKELICGGDYTHTGVRFLQLIGLTVWVLLIGTGFFEIYRRRATWPAAIAWSVSTLLLVGISMLALSLPANECP